MTNKKVRVELHMSEVGWIIESINKKVESLHHKKKRRREDFASLCDMLENLKETLICAPEVND